MNYRSPVRYTLFFLLLLSSASLARGATVEKINKKKKTAIVGLDDASTFKRGAKVCAFKKDKKITCGTVKRVKNKKATVQFKHITKVKKGYSIELKDSKGKKATKPADGDPYRYGLSAYWPAYFIPATPATYNKLSYAGLTADAASPPSLWKNEGPATENGDSSSPLQMVMGAAGELNLTTFSSRLGFHYKIYRTFIAVSDYAVEGVDPYIQTELSGTAFGLYYDFIPLQFATYFTLGAGLDLDMSSLSLSALQKSDSDASAEATVFTATSTTNIVSLRLPLRFEYFLPSYHLGFFAGVTFMLPLTALGGSLSFETTVADDANSQKVGADNLQADFEASLNHTKNSFALEFPIGLVVGF